MKKGRTKKAKIKEADKPKKSLGRILCIILLEGSGSKWVWLKDTDTKFSIDGNTYFKGDDGTYIKGITRIKVYLEGISLPIHHGYLERETKTVEIINRDTGKKEKHKINKIKGLNFDSKVIDMLLNRNLADEFTKQHMDLPNLAIIILLIVGWITTIITSVAIYMKLG